MIFLSLVVVFVGFGDVVDVVTIVVVVGGGGGKSWWWCCCCCMAGFAWV